MVNDYVDAILKDPSINLSTVPDSLERILYASTVQTTMNTVYQALSALHGTELLGHVLVLDRVPMKESLFLKAGGDSGRIDKKVLEAMADELLKNKAINQAWIPDVVERQIYSNCLMIIFTLLDRIADTLSIRMCGHELGIRFEPLTEAAARELVQRNSGHRQQHLDIDSATLDALVDDMLQETEKTCGTHFSFHDAFLVSVHKTLCE